jgi:formylglycine-generating enzyme required for sulfatase activity
MTGLGLPDLTHVNNAAVAQALRDLRARNEEPRGMILQLEVVSSRLRRAGLSDTNQARAEVLRDLFRDLNWTGLCQARGQVNGSRPPMDADRFPADPAADFRSEQPDRQAWSAVWYRYLSDEAHPVSRLHEVTGVARATFNRRQLDGIEHLTQALQQAEAEARRGLVAPDVPSPLSPDAEQRARADAILRRVKDALAQDRPDALDLDAADRRLILSRSWDSLDLYRLRQALVWSDERYQLDERFVDLSLLVDLGEDAPTERWQLKERRYQSLDAALADQPDPAFVVLGAPGSGKSTLLRHHELGIMLDGLRGATERISLYVPLSRHGSRDDDVVPPAPHTWLAAQWAADHPDLPSLPELLAEQRVTLLLDAVNEMPHRDAEAYLARVGQWQAFVAELAQRLPGNRVVFSCRSLDYSAPLSTKELAVPQLRIEPLDDAKVRSFLAAYCPRQADRVWEALEGQPQLGLLRTPFLLRMLALQAERQRQVPTGRAALFSSFIRGALRHEVQGGNRRFDPGPLLAARDRQRILNTQQWPRPFDLPGSGLFPPLADLAYAMQDRHGSTEAAQIRLPYEAALAALDATLPLDHAEAVLLAGCDLGILDQDRGQDDLLFRHQLLQEYFAARKLAQAPRAALAASEWRAEAISPSVESLIATLPPAEPLPPLPTTGWEETMLLAAAMSPDQDAFVDQLAETNLPLAGRCAAQPESKVSEPVRERLRWALVSRSRDAAADLRARIAAGEALGELGDPRFKRCVSAEGVEYLLPPMVRVPAGMYTIGSDEGIYPEEAPEHQVWLDEFWIGQFPVTNAEYACFIKAGGYEDERWWVGEAALAWKQGSLIDGRIINTLDMYDRCKAYPELLEDLWIQGTIDDEQHQRMMSYLTKDRSTLKQELIASTANGNPISTPRFWHNPRFSGYTRPVVGVCWFEARAYVAWLEHHSGKRFRLPSEVDWEAAARVSLVLSCTSSWMLSGQVVNSRRLHIGTTTPVATVGGDLEDAAADMLGNCSEWTNSVYTEYPQHLRVESLSEHDVNVVRIVTRGGGFCLGDVDVRLSCRIHVVSTSRSSTDGFRLELIMK